MTKGDYTQFALLMATCGEIFEKTLSTSAIKLYWEILKPFPINRVEEATNVLVKTRKYSGFPKPAEFLDYLSPAQDLRADAILAFDHTQDRLNLDGCYSNLHFDDPKIVAVIKMYGGLQEYNRMVSGMTKREFEFHRKDWIERYQVIAVRPDLQCGNTLIGIFASNNQLTGHALQVDRLAISDTGDWVSIVSSSDCLETSTQVQIENPSEIDEPEGQVCSVRKEESEAQKAMSGESSSTGDSESEARSTPIIGRRFEGSRL